MTLTTTTYLASAYSISPNANSRFAKLSAAYETGSPISDTQINRDWKELVKYSGEPPAGNGAPFPGPQLTRLSVADSTSTMFSFVALMQSGDGCFSVPANNLVERLLAQNQGLVANALQKCRDVLDEVDGSDDNSRESARERLKDVFDIFTDLSAGLISELTEAYRDRPDVIGFVLSECFVKVDSIRPEVKVDVVSRLTLNARAAIRYEAVRALDAINDAAASQTLQLLQTSETNSDVKSFIEASLRSQSLP
jgi:hypothetical protein